MDIYKGILSDLHDFHSQQEVWLRLNERLKWEHASFDKQIENFNSATLDSILNNNNQFCMKKSLSDGENNNLDKKQSNIPCNFVENPISEMDHLNIQNLFNYVESETKRINKHLNKKTGAEPQNIIKELSDQQENKSNNIVDQTVGDKLDDKEKEMENQEPASFPKFPTTMSFSNNEYFDKKGWPTESECKKWNLPVNEKEDLRIPIFLPPENKGFEVNKMLSELIDVPEDTEHKLPWYPPNCDRPNISGEKYILANDRQAINTKLNSNKYLKDHLLKYVNNGKSTTNEAEIGQRIITAIDKKIAPNWVLATLASLYWRIRGNTKKTLDCLDLAIQTVPKEQSDVVLISISSIINELGFTNHSLKFANLAFKLNYVEPSTNLLLGLIYYQNKNPVHAMYYLKNVLRVDKDYYNGHVEFLLKLWGCRVKIVNAYDQKKSTRHHNRKEEICLKSSNGGGINECQPTASIQCYRTKNLDGTEPTIQEKKKAIAGDGIGKFGSASLGDFYVSVALNDEPVPKAMLQIYDKSGTYPLSPQKCQDLIEADNDYYSVVYKKLLTRNIEIISYLEGFTGYHPAHVKPFCTETKSSNLDHLTTMILRKKLPNLTEEHLEELLSLIAGYNKKTTSIKEIGGKIGLALKDNATSWILAHAAAIYWRIVGNAEEALNCLRLSLNNVPNDMKDLPLNNLASILQRVAFHTDALEIAYLALKSNPNFVVNHFTVGNIFSAMGDLEDAITFYRSSLALDTHFEPARNKLQTLLCTLLFDDSGSLKNLGN